MLWIYFYIYLLYCYKVIIIIKIKRENNEFNVRSMMSTKSSIILPMIIVWQIEKRIVFDPDIENGSTKLQPII